VTGIESDICRFSAGAGAVFVLACVLTGFVLTVELVGGAFSGGAQAVKEIKIPRKIKT
jgi:hypothetical protein